jgi:hypothetical protein
MTGNEPEEADWEGSDHESELQDTIDALSTDIRVGKLLIPPRHRLTASRATLCEY